MSKRYAVGIDPGVHTGYAVYDRHDKYLVEMATMDFWKVVHQLERCRAEDVLVIIEVPTLKRMYRRNDNNSSDARVRESMTNRMGSNRREAELLADGIEQMGFEVRRVTPSRKKWTAEDLKRYTKIDKRTNEHVRDAIALVWGV